MRALLEGRIESGGAFARHIDLCLGCRACEPVCPSGVPYGRLLESSRAEVMAAGLRRGSVGARIVEALLTRVFTRPRLLGFLFMLGRRFRDAGFARLALECRLLSGRSEFAMALLASSASGDRKRRVGGSRGKLTSRGSRQRVALFQGCVMSGLFRDTNRDTEFVLERNGVEMVEAPAQVCCGALHAHAGFPGAARDLAGRNIEVFLEAGVDVVVVNAAGCGAALKEYPEWLEDSARARVFSSRVKDISEFLIERGLDRPVGSVRARVAYDAPCHLIHAQRVREAPRTLLEAIPGLELVPLEGSESCCGGAGIYNLQHIELSRRLLDEKIRSINASGCDVVVTGNPGCIMQLGAGLLLDNRSTRVVHPVELLRRAYDAEVS